MRLLGERMRERPTWAPAEIDISRPSVARVYDYYLGGSHNFESDRLFARDVLTLLPEMPRIAQDNRAFLRRAVRYLCSQGIDQFIDLGSGIPTVGNVHEVALAANPRARVVYVDNDPVAVTHSRQLLAGNDQTKVISADLRDPAGVLADPILQELIDLQRPVAILLVAVLHFVSDAEDPAGIVAGYAAATVPDSFVVISHAATGGRREAAGVQDVYNQRARSPHPMRMRSREEVKALFGDLTLIDPGVVAIPHWRPDPADGEPPAPDNYPGYAGVARRD